MIKNNVLQNRILLHSLFWLSLFVSGCSCDKEKSVSLPNTEIKLISSSENGVKYKIYVSLPEGIIYLEVIHIETVTLYYIYWTQMSSFHLQKA